MRYIPKTIPYIIAEVGACHNNDIAEALRLIESSESVGCQAVKFQFYDAAMLSARRHAPELFQAYDDFQLPLSWLSILQAKCKERGVDFILSVFEGFGAEYVALLVDALKISSFEAQDSALLQSATEQGKPLIVSTGMSTPSDLTRLRTIRDESSCPIALLHCVSSYPAACEELNLSVIHTEDLDGYSDHSADVLAGAFAVAAGANILEVHVRNINTPHTNPDYPHALDVPLLADYVLFANKAYRMRGTGVRVVTPGEQANLRYKHQEGT